jgi:5-methyltetrahydropteroyltriglutamate--homocysteine methyltransferase
MNRSTHRILATHTGRLFKPGSGWQGMGIVSAPPTPEELKQDMTELVKAQVDIGMDVISNGEPAGIGPFSLFGLIEGFENRQVSLPEGQRVPSPKQIRWISREMEQFPDFYANMFEQTNLGNPRARSAMQTVVTGPLKLRTVEPFERDIRMFKEILIEYAPDKEAFYCVVAPAWLEEFVWNEYYATDDEFVVALSAVMAPIFKTVTDNGLILQIDDPAISHDWEEIKRPPMTLKDYEKFIMLRVEALNAALGGIPEEMIRFHVCWGSWPGMHTDNLPLKALVKPMLKVKAQAYSIESAKATHRHEWKVWRDVVKLPADKILIPGVVDHTTSIVEPPEVIADQLMQFAQVVGKENVQAGTDCGMRGHATAAWEKYKNIVKGAELASRQLWG